MMKLRSNYGQQLHKVYSNSLLVRYMHCIMDFNNVHIHVVFLLLFLIMIKIPYEREEK